MLFCAIFFGRYCEYSELREPCFFKIRCIDCFEGKVWVEYKLSLTIDFGDSLSSRNISWWCVIDDVGLILAE